MIELKKISDISVANWLELLNHPLVKRHMPLAYEDFTSETIVTWISGKEKIWEENNYGPWAILVDNFFVGWGGLQPENGEPDFGLVLHPKHWGRGKAIFDFMLHYVKSTMDLKYITIHLPISRTRLMGIKKLGFVKDGNVKLEGSDFVKYRLDLI